MADDRARITKVMSGLIVVDDGIFATRAGAYAEIVGGELRVTSAGMMGEILSDGELRVTSAGMIAEILADSSSGPPVVTEFSRGAASTRSHYRLPAEVTGYALDPSWSFWSVVVPEETLNLLSNPSFEESTSLNMVYAGGITNEALSTSAGSVAGSFALTAELDGTSASITQRFQSVGGQITNPIAGAYTFSCWVWAQAETQMQLYIENVDTSAVYGATSFVVDYTGWHRYWISCITPSQANLACKLQFPSGAGGGVFYTDAWQLENKLYPTTYCDGDMLGFFDGPDLSPYSWSGIAHQSTSIRERWTRSGGRLYNLAEDAEFFTTSITGLNMKTPDLETRTLASGKEVFVGSKWKNRTFTITGRFYGKSYEEVIFKRDRLVHYMQPDHLGSREPLILQYALTDSRGREVTTPVEIVCSLTGGLEGNFTNFYSENYAMQFRAFSGIRNKIWNVSDNIDPFSYRVWLPDGFHINPGPYHSAGQLINGGWSDFQSSIPPDGFVEDMSWSWINNTVIMCGNFTTLVDQVGLDSVLEYDVGDNTFDDMIDTPVGSWDSYLYRISYGRGNRSAYIMGMGDFTLKGAGVIRRLTIKNAGNAWTEADDGLSAPVGAVDIGRILPLPDGRFMVGGDFVTDAPVAVVYQNIGIYDVGTNVLSPMEVAGGPGLNAAVHDMVYGRDGFIYICGAFTAAISGTTLLLVCKYDLLLDVFTALGTGITTAVSTAHHIAYGPDGYIYVAHGTTAGGVATTISRWNGTSWSEHFSVESGGHIGGMAFDKGGSLHITGSMSTVLAIQESGTQRNYIELSQNVVRHGQLYSETDFNEPEKIFIDERGRMMVTEGGFTFSGAAWENTVEVFITNDGTAESYPIFVLENRTYRIMKIELPQVGALLNFDRRFTVNTDEILYLDFSGESPRIYSNQRTDLNKFLIPGTSNLKDFRLLPGRNEVRFCISSDNVYDRNFRIRWRNEYQSIDPGTPL